MGIFWASSHSNSFDLSIPFGEFSIGGSRSELCIEREKESWKVDFCDKYLTE